MTPSNPKNTPDYNPDHNTLNHTLNHTPDHPNTLTGIRIWNNDLPADYDAHWHLPMEIIMPVENWYDVTVGEQQFHLVPGDILFIPPGELHTLRAPDTGKRRIYLFNLSFLTGLKDFTDIQTILSSPLLINRAACPAVYDDARSLLTQMSEEYYARSEFAELTIFSLLLKLFVTLGTYRLDQIHLFTNIREYKQKEYMEKFSSVINYIDSHYMDELNLDDIARSVGFSKYHFSRLFKQYTGSTFGAYICKRRIKVAEELLLLPDISVTGIALQSGFASIATFNRVFKQQKGCTPSEYRQKMRPFRS